MATSRKHKPPQRWSQVQSRTFYRVVLIIVSFLLRVWVRRWRFVGVENVPPSGGAFLIANHTSGVDPLIIGVAVPYRLMAGPGKVEIFKNRFFAYLMRRIGIFPLRAGEADAAAVRTMVDLYRHGRVVIVYPEGGRSATEEMKPFTPDFARLMIKLKAPIIPAGIAGAQDLLPIHSWVPRPGRPIAVVFGEPFELSQFYDRPSTPESLKEATDILQNRVAELVACARREREALLRHR